MIAESRPSKDCEACTDYKENGYSECYCSCHIVGNIILGYHHHFNYLDLDYKFKTNEAMKWPRIEN